MRRVEALGVSEYIDLYREIGRDYLWNYRPGQSLTEIAEIIHSPKTWIYLLFDRERAVGMAELDVSNPEDIELVHFGLIPRLLNRGLGRLYLQNVLRVVWESGAARIWLSTCGMDHPNAVTFYEVAGFVIFKTARGEFKDWRFTGFYDMSDAPRIPFGVRVSSGTEESLLFPQLLTNL